MCSFNGTKRTPKGLGSSFNRSEDVMDKGVGSCDVQQVEVWPERIA
jgi:hypothetical protein